MASRAAALILFSAADALAVPVTFTVDVPYCTPDVVLLRSNRTTAAEYLHDPLAQIGPTTWSGTFDVATDLGQFNYKYSHTLCDATSCAGIEKALMFTGSGGEIPDRTLAPGTTSVADRVFIWRDALAELDAMGTEIGVRLDSEKVAFCGPYLSATAPGEITIGYDAFRGGTVLLEWGTDATYGSSATSTGHRNHFRLSGLDPGREHHYRITEDGRAGPDRTFFAPPPAGQPFRFAMLGDTQYYEERQRLDHSAITGIVDAFDPHLMLSVGDMVASEPGAGGPGGWMYPEMGRWNVFFGVSADLMARAPFMAAMGNHEEDAPYFWDVFAFPEPDAPAIDHYDFTYGNVHFTALYTGSTDGYDREGILDSQTPWLDATLARAAADPAVRWKIVFLHRGPYSQGANHPTDGQSFYESSSPSRASWRSILMQHGVDLVLAGHNHNFTYAQADGIRFLTACSGAPVHNLRTEVIPTTIHAEALCTANLFRAREKTLSFEAWRSNGTVIEEARFTLCRAAADCEELPSSCASATRWACTSGACEVECFDLPDAGEPDAMITADAEADAGEIAPDAAGPGPDATADAGRKDAGFFGMDDGDCGCRSTGGGRIAWGVLLPILGSVVRRRRMGRLRGAWHDRCSMEGS